MKKITWLMLALLLLLPSTALAHSKLESAIPDKESVVEASPQSVQMTFNTKIEKLSTFKLFNSNNEQIDVKDIAVDGAVLSGSIPEALANDEYTVKWMIIGADGHAIDGQYTFEVNAPLTESSTAPDASSQAESPAPTNEPTITPTEQTAPSSEPTTDTSASTDKKDSSSNSTIYIIIAGAIIVIGLIILATRRKK